MYKPSFTAEATQQLRRQERTENIIFLDIYWVLFNSHLYPSSRDLKSRETVDDIEKHPAIVGKFSKESVELLKSSLETVQSFSPEALTNLRNLCVTHKARIVITAPWFDITTREQFKIIFALSGLSDYILDVIEEFPKKTRGEKIEDWLLKQVRVVNSFVILDHNDDRISPRFGERLVYCRYLFAEDALYQQALKVLAKPMDYEKSQAKCYWDAIAGNAPQLTEISINAETITTLKLCFSWDTHTLLDNLFLALTNNTHIKRLSLHSFHEHTEAAWFLERVSILLVNCKMNLEYLSLAHNRLVDIAELLKAIETKKLHIPHLCFNANPLRRENQGALASWIASYAMPIKLDLDLTESGWGHFELHRDVISALMRNDKVSVHTREEVLPFHFGDQQIPALRKAGRLVVEADKEKEHCCLM